MALGSDKEICKSEFVEAMRARLEEEKPGMGANVDDPGVQKNFAALGEAAFRIATLRAEPCSDSSTDAGFWKWVDDTQTWLAALSTWQKGVRQAFTAWAAATPAEQALRAAVIGLADPGAPPSAAPSSLKGRIR